MTLGPRLVIPGTIIGGILLSIFLYLATAGASFPTPVYAAMPPSTPTPASDQQELFADAVDTGDEGPTTDIDGVAGMPPEGCTMSASFPQSILQWCGTIAHYAGKRGLDPNLIGALILQESGGNASAYSKSGAVGLMQVMPNDGLASAFMCPAGPCFSNRPSTDQLYDPEFNISYGTKMLAGLINRHGAVREALKSYGPMDVGYYYADIVLGIFERYRY